MPIRKYNPTSPGRAVPDVQTFDEITTTSRTSRWSSRCSKSGGRNNHGELTSWWRGGGHKRNYRIIDFKRDKRTSRQGRDDRVRPEPLGAHRAADLRRRREALHPAAVGLKVGDTIVAGDNVDILPGNALPLKNIPLGTQIHNVELKPGKGGQIARSAGSSVQLVAKEGDYASVKMPSGEIRKINVECSRRSARSATSITRTCRSARPAAAAGWASAARPRRRDEPGRPPARRRRRQDLGRPPPGVAVGPADQGLQEPQEQASSSTSSSSVAASQARREVDE
jgi:ribosomal protein L2